MSTPHLQGVHPYVGVIVAVNEGDSRDPELVTYDWFGYSVIEQGSTLELHEQMPQRRITEGSKFLPARVGDAAFCVVTSEGVRLMVQEGIRFTECEPQG